MRRSAIKPSPFTTLVSSFSTSSGGGGGGRGGGRGFISPNHIFTNEHDSQPPPGVGHGQIGSDKPGPALGRGRGRGIELGTRKSVSDPIPGARQIAPLPSSIFSSLNGGAGRGKVPNPPPPPSDKPRVENRHIRAPKPQDSGEAARLSREEAVKQGIGILSRGGDGGEAARLSREEAVKKAIGILSRGGGAQGFRGWRGRGGGRGRGRGRGDRGTRPSEDDDYATGLYLGDDKDGEKLANRLGPDVMNQLAEGFEEMASRVLPSPLDDAYEDALRTNLMIECEPEYLMPDFATNPDIDDTPPMPLTDALQKMKPFLMAYENIQSHQEWEEAVEETMKSVPLLKEIVDLYGGPDVVTAMQQQQELERVAKTIPERGPASVKRFANNAVLSLQSNPGWGFDKKCQLMDKLAQEISQQYK